jgi:DNA-binding CsgD family transcriptional regulator
VLFRRVSVFRGGSTLEAAESVAGGGTEFLDHLDGVISQSLIRAEPHGAEVRLVMLQTIAEYGRDRLSAAGEMDAVRRAHAAYFLHMAEREHQAMRSADRERSLGRLDRDHENLRLALAHLMEAEEHRDALRMVAALARFLADRGHLEEGRRWLGDALRLGVDAGPELRMRVVLGAALLAYEDERIEEATQLAETALAYFRRTGEISGCVQALEILAEAQRFHGNRQAAMEIYEEALQLADGSGDRWLVAHLMEHQGLAAWAAGHNDRADRALSASLEAFRAMGDRQGEAFALWALGSVDAVAGQLELGIRRMEQSLPLLREGRHRRQLARALYNLGVAYLRNGEIARAEGVLIEGTLTFRDVKLDRHVSLMLPAFAVIAVERGDTTRAARLLGATQRQYETLGWSPPMPIHQLWEQCTERVRDEMRAAIFATAWSRGRALSLEEALEEAMRPARDAHTGLTSRETEILQLLAQGLSDADIAQQLILSVRTVHAHLRSLYSKLGVGSRTAAVRRASELGLVLLR